MTSYASRFYCAATQQSGSAAQQYDLSEATVAANTTTNVQYSTTAQTSKQVIPLTGSTAQKSPPASGGAATNIGWRLKTADVNASSGEPRVITAGTTTVPVSITTGTYALLAANPNYSMLAILYKLSSAGVSTEIGRGTSTLAIAATTTQTLTPSITHSDITLNTGELLQVECYLTASATANALNQITNNVVTVNLGTVTGLALANPLRTVATRSNSDAVSVPSDSVSRVLGTVRQPSGALTTADSGVRAITANRQPSESLTQAASTFFTATYPRISADATPSSLDSVLSVQADFRRASDLSNLATDDTARRVVTSRRALVDSMMTTDSALKLVIYGRTARYDFVPGDQPLIDPTRQVTGVIRNGDGTPYLGSATVYLVRDDNLVVASTLSSPTDGSYNFLRNSYDTATYYVVAFTDGGFPMEGVTERGLVPS